LLKKISLIVTLSGVTEKRFFKKNDCTAEKPARAAILP